MIIITKNEADRLERCLESVRPIADEIIVLDSGSTDTTVDIARRYTDKVYVTDWPGYGPQKQRALEKATCRWVLSIDADEALSESLQKEIDETLSAGGDAVAYRLPWAVCIFGKRLRFGRSARAPLRLFIREGSRFSDDIVHEKVIVPPGPVKKMKGKLFHYTCRDFAHYLQKNREYAWLGAQRKFAQGKRGFGLPGAVFHALWTFIVIYFFRLGILDGGVGFLVAAMYSQGSFNKYAGLWLLRREAKRSAMKACER